MERPLVLTVVGAKENAANLILGLNGSFQMKPVLFVGHRPVIIMVAKKGNICTFLKLLFIVKIKIQVKEIISLLGLNVMVNGKNVLTQKQSVKLCLLVGRLFTETLVKMPLISVQEKALRLKVLALNIVSLIA